MSYTTNKTAGLEHTVKADLNVVGLSKQTDQANSLTIHPSEAGHGIHFLRTDVESGKGLVGARWYYIDKTSSKLVLKNEHGTEIRNFEPLLAALYHCNIDNALIVLDRPGVPQFENQPDGIVRLLRSNGIVPQACRQHMIWINRPVEIWQGDNYATLLPHSNARVSMDMDRDNDYPSGKIVSVPLWPSIGNPSKKAGATPRFQRQLSNLQARGRLKYSHIKDMPEVEKCINSFDGFKHEQTRIIRSNMVTILANLALTAVPVIGHLYVRYADYNIMGALINKLFDERRTWSHMTLDELLSITQYNTADVH